MLQWENDVCGVAGDMAPERRALARVRETVTLPCAVARRRREISARSRLSLGSTSALSRLSLGSTSALPRLHLGSTSALSRLYLASRPSELCGQLPTGRRPEPQGSAGEGGSGGTVERRLDPSFRNLLPSYEAYLREGCASDATPAAAKQEEGEGGVGTLCELLGERGAAPPGGITSGRSIALHPRAQRSSAQRSSAQLRSSRWGRALSDAVARREGRGALRDSRDVYRFAQASAKTALRAVPSRHIESHISPHLPVSLLGAARGAVALRRDPLLARVLRSVRRAAVAQMYPRSVGKEGYPHATLRAAVAYAARGA